MLGDGLASHQGCIPVYLDHDQDKAVTEYEWIKISILNGMLKIILKVYAYALLYSMTRT